MLSNFLEIVIPEIIHLLEAMGVIIIFIGAIKALDINKSVSGAITIFADDNKKYISTDLMNKEPVKSEFISSDVKLLDFRVL